MKLRIGSDGFTLPAELAADAVSIVGRRGRGKTTTAVVLVEKLAGPGARFCVADPVGVWSGLKSSRDGKSAGLPVIVMGGDRGDVPLEETAGKLITYPAPSSEPDLGRILQQPGLAALILSCPFIGHEWDWNDHYCLRCLRWK